MATNGQVPHLDWWAEQLKDNTVAPLTRDYPETTSENIARRPIEAVEALGSSEKLRLALASLKNHGHVYEILLTTLIVLVSRLTGDEDISIGANVQPNGAPFVLRVPVSSSDTFSALLKKTSIAISEAESYPAPLAEVRSRLKTKALFRFAAFNSSGDTTVDNVDTTDFLLQYYVSTGGAIEFRARYNQRLFSSNRIASVLAQLLQFIENVEQMSVRQLGVSSFQRPNNEVYSQTHHLTLAGHHSGAPFTTSLLQMQRHIPIDYA